MGPEGPPGSPSVPKGSQGPGVSAHLCCIHSTPVEKPFFLCLKKKKGVSVVGKNLVFDFLGFTFFKLWNDGIKFTEGGVGTGQLESQGGYDTCHSVLYKFSFYVNSSQKFPAAYGKAELSQLVM